MFINAGSEHTYLKPLAWIVLHGLSRHLLFRDGWGCQTEIKVEYQEVRLEGEREQQQKKVNCCTLFYHKLLQHMEHQRTAVEWKFPLGKIIFLSEENGCWLNWIYALSELDVWWPGSFWKPPHHSNAGPAVGNFSETNNPFKSLDTGIKSAKI